MTEQLDLIKADRKIGIYMIVAPDGRRYIGSSVDVKRRLTQHRSSIRLGNHDNSRLRSISLDVNKFVFSSIFCVLDKTHLLSIEQQFIDDLQPELNVALIAVSPMLCPNVRALASLRVKASEKHAAARIKNQKQASAAISRRIIRLTDNVVFESGYAAARDCNAARPDNIYTAIKNSWKFGGHYWKYEDTDVLLSEIKQAAAARAVVGRARTTKAMIEDRGRAIKRLVDDRIFTTITSAAKEMGCTNGALIRALKTGSNSKGSRWEYV